ncbi:MAG: 2-C-methyl-D-erythritol 2,4-cyclodiphosphate synthase, partial [Bryobacteraceae bacterium]
VTDAILGAVALGDIGMHFPDSDEEWKDANSLAFLQRAQALAHGAGYGVSSLDATVILERPKLKNFRLQIRESLASALALPLECVSVKFKTAERVGPVGEGLSCEAQAVVVVMLIS